MCDYPPSCLPSPDLGPGELEITVEGDTSKAGNLLTFTLTQEKVLTQCVHACVCVCACVRACVRVCVCVCTINKLCEMAITIPFSFDHASLYVAESCVYYFPLLHYRARQRTQYTRGILVMV